ncbi:MAG TPA: glycosyltransferase family 1 protein [Saprospiraceae bacterium]|nr:glycosyltransferase family 1 protein [Saprospiraceae bacterium]
MLTGRLEGLGWYTHEIMRRMVLQHPEDEFIFLFDRPYDPAFLYGPNVTPLVLFPPARHPLLWYWWFEWSVAGALRRLRPDVFFSPDSYLSLRSATPVVMTCHDLVPLHQPGQVPFAPRNYYRFFLPRFLRRADHLVTVSEFVRRDIEQTCNVDPGRISAVYNGCREGFFPLNEFVKQEVRSKYANGEHYFFYAGAIHPRKNIPRLIRAFDQFKKSSGSPQKLLLAGRFAWQTGEVRTAVESSEYRQDIVLLGYVDDQTLPLLLGASTALVYVSQSEGFGLPVLEAFHAEAPVITSNVTALPEVAGDAAMLVDPMSEHEIAAAMVQIVSEPGLGERLVEKGRMQRKQFDWDVAAEKIYQILLSTAQGNKITRP